MNVIPVEKGIYKRKGNFFKNGKEGEITIVMDWE